VNPDFTVKPLMSVHSDADEYVHLPTKRPDWRESYYFNFVDIERGVSGFSTIGLLPNLSKREFVFALFYGGKREVYFKESEGRIPKDLFESLSDGRLSYELVTPLKEWRIRFAGEEISADLKWIARFPAHFFGGGSKTSWSNHFEQSGEVSGTMKLPGGARIDFSGLGQRDKSWGPRDWHIEAWFALHAQFDTLSIGLRRDLVGGKVQVSGGISSADGHAPISKVDLETVFAYSPRMPIGAITKVHGVDGRVYSIVSSLISQNSFARFSRPYPGGTTELFEEMAIHDCKELGQRGTGIVEWLFTQPKS